MSYKDGKAKNTGKDSEMYADDFLEKHWIISEKPYGQDVGIDRIVYLPENPNKIAKIQIKGRSQDSNPRWFQLSISGAQLRDAVCNGEDLNALWKKRIYMVDFFMMVSLPKANPLWNKRFVWE